MRKKDNVIILGKCKIASDVKFYGECVVDESEIGSGCVIKSSYIEHSIIKNGVTIGPYSHIRPESVIEGNVKIGNFVEIKASHIGARTKVAHLAYVGDSNLGENVNVGCGVIFANYDGKDKHKTIVGSNVFIGSNSNLVAPLTLGDNCFIAAGTTVTRDVNEKDFCIGRVRQEIKHDYDNKYFTGEKAKGERTTKMRFFGTDGIRGVFNKDITEKTAAALGRCLCLQTKAPIVIIGRDTRTSGVILEQALSSAISSLGGKVLKAGICSTPALSFLTKHYNCDYGVMITASHNKSDCNGLKVFEKGGEKLCAALEKIIDKMMETEIIYELEKKTSKNQKNVEKKPYLDLLLANGTDLNNKKILLDCANGGGTEIAKEVFSKLNAQLILINCDCLSEINHNSGCLNQQLLSKAVVESGCDMGFSFDGDADRIIACDEMGGIIDGDGLILAFATYLKNIGKLKNEKVAFTIQSSLALRNELEKQKIASEITDVGDKYVIDALNKFNLSLGGEQSGHIIFHDIVSSGDGILAALILSKICVFMNTKLSSICRFKAYPQLQKSFVCKNKHELVRNSKIIEVIAKAEKELSPFGRAYVRASGTEEKIRLLVECESEKKCTKHFNELSAIIENIVTEEE